MLQAGILVAKHQNHDDDSPKTDHYSEAGSKDYQRNGGYRSH